MTENYFFTHEPKLNIHHEYSVFSRKTPMYVATVLLAISITDSIQPKGGVTMTGEGILFCFSMLFIFLFLLGRC